MTKPEFRVGSHLLPGLVAVALFAVMATVFLTAGFAAPAGFGDASVMEAIGYALLNIDVDNGIPVEGFLFAFILIAVALDAALDGAIMLARREEDDSLTSALQTDGGDDRTERGEDR
ncbi:NADH-quinone oxidoreductase subunit J [Natronoarchaeum rubrum]|uniref:NADH-quinone oxidoreductase subunit J n=1 Tax=Natronoarchaeum rubrum TaxID=755311 RepID=UPI0021126B44|nr:NADH-quinone oxidoreductase subunit J [Natronoarchaeum rubrum]